MSSGPTSTVERSFAQSEPEREQLHSQKAGDLEADPDLFFGVAAGPTEILAQAAVVMQEAADKVGVLRCVWRLMVSTETTTLSSTTGRSVP
jgi:hypothetical protein